jgi:hypothetical protein
MARQIRIEYAGVVYPVMARGNHGQAILADDLDRRGWHPFIDYETAAIARALKVSVAWLLGESD